jgi:hypothetical protein
MNNRIILREYAYFDRQKVEDFLSSIENGLTRERRETKSKINAEVKGKVYFGVIGAEGGLGHKSTELQELKASTDASLFQRLYTHLEKQKFIQVLEKIDSKNFEQIKEGSILELIGEIELLKMEIIMDLFAIYSKFFGSKQMEENNQRQILSLLNIIQQYGINIKIILQDKSYNIVATLIREKLRVPKQNLNGKYKVLCRVQRKLKKGETFDIFSFAPGIKLPEEVIQKMIVGWNQDKNLVTLLGSLKIEDFRISYPAIIVTPIAIYR